MKKLLILVLTNFFILMLILIGRPAKAQTTDITGQFLYGLELYVLPEKQQTPDYSTAIYSRTIDEDDFIRSGLYQNWLQPRLPDNINGYIYLVDSSHTIRNVYLGGGYLEQGQTLSYPFEPSIEMKHYQAQLITLFILNPVNKILFETPSLDYIVYYENNDGTTPRIKLIDATNNENDYNRVRLTINGYDTGYNAGYSTGYNNGQNNGYNSGYEDGQNNGYSAGYNAGQNDFYNDYYQQIYEDGYNAGLGDRQLGVNTVLNFNQICPNGNFESTSGWSILSNYGSWYVSNNRATTVWNGTASNWYECRLYRNINWSVGHKYYITADIYSTFDTVVSIGRTGADKINGSILRGETKRVNGIITLTGTGELWICLNRDLTAHENDYNYTSNVMVIDLTQIYGEGNEPTSINEVLSDFPSEYYPYTTTQLINIDYENGYKSGYDNAYPVGYDDGISYQATQQLTSDGWIRNIFTGISSFLAIEILPGVSIGLIVGIPFIITVAWFVLKMARGGSAE